MFSVVFQASSSLAGRVVDVVGDEATLGAGQRDEATLCVPAPQVVIVPGRGVRRRAQEGGVLDVGPRPGQVRVVLPPDDVVDIRTWAVAPVT